MQNSTGTDARIARSVMLKLVEYCRKNKWAGFDPYDALNSKVFGTLPFFNTRIPRLALTQILKRSPVNIRPLLLVPKTQNPKGIALFLSAFLRLTDSDLDNRDKLIREMIDRLIVLRSCDSVYWNWGYSFPWQTRSVLVPAGTANLVCTTFVASALLDAYEQRNDLRCLRMAVSAAEYLRTELFWENGSSACGFSYPLPEVQSQTHNANFLAASLLCRVYKHTDDRRLLKPALNATRYSVSKQHPDGSWAYGEHSSQQWVDNFHTGYNLCALQTISSELKTTEFDSSIQRGFEFYKSHFFRGDGAPKYFHDRSYPIDIHSVAQSIVTLLSFRDLDSGNPQLASSVFRWAIRHMWDERGFFYYRVLPWCTIRTSYMRWSQAWMLRAISAVLGECKPNQTSNQDEHLQLERAH